jgi:hypothetical protein
MKNPLDQIEARLQTLIESSALLLPGETPRPPLAHLLVQAMRSHLRPDSSGGLMAPGLYLIHVNPQTLLQWSDTEVKLPFILQESARDAGITFAALPVIRLMIDSTLSGQDIRIEIPDSNVSSGYTAIIIPEAPIRREPTQPPPVRLNAYLIVNGGDLFTLDQPVINIGRRHDNHLVIEDARVSRSHCQLRLVQHNYVLFDLNSTGGTFVNNNRITHQTLKAGDVISLAGAQLIYGEDSIAPGQGTDRFLDDDTANLKKGSLS